MNTIRLRAVGDNLIHIQLYEAARLTEGGYDFHGMYEHILGLINEAEIAVINQETILVEDENKVSSFPAFGSPMAVGDAIIDAGFNVVTHASNHALDKGYKAICDTVSYWERRQEDKDIVYTGIHTSKEDQEKIRVVVRDGIRVAILNYTSTLNYHPVMPSHSYCVDVMKGYTKGRIKKQIEEARKIADIVAVFPHWGCEYLYEPVDLQKEWAFIFANAGADIIIGTHPHVVQNMTVITTEDNRKVPCIFSLGNYISCQVNQGTMLGGMADVEITKGNNRAKITKAKIIPLVTHTDDHYGHFTTYPLSSYTDELAGENKIFKIMERNLGIRIDTEYLNKLFNDIMTKQAMKDSVFKRPSDVTWANIVGVYNALRGVNTKE